MVSLSFLFYNKRLQNITLNRIDSSKSKMVKRIMYESYICFLFMQSRTTRHVNQESLVPFDTISVYMHLELVKITKSIIMEEAGSRWTNLQILSAYPLQIFVCEYHGCSPCRHAKKPRTNPSIEAFPAIICNQCFDNLACRRSFFMPHYL